MTIKEVSRITGLSQDTLRYYERIGAIPPVHRTRSGIREYSDEDLKWIQLARCMRSAGLSVESIIEYVRLSMEGDATIPARLDLLQEQKKELLEKKAEIDAALDRLDNKIAHYEEALITGVLDWNSTPRGNGKEEN